MRWPRFATFLLLFSSETRAEQSAGPESQGEATVPGPTSLRDATTRALEWYDAGEGRRARDHLRELIASCDGGPPSRCLPVDHARLFIALGVVLSETCESEAELAFRSAVRLDPGATLLDDDVTSATRRLLLTARYKEYCLGKEDTPRVCEPPEAPVTAERERAPQSSDPTVDRPPVSNRAESTPPASIGRTLLMMQAQAGGGTAEGVPAAYAGAGALVGILPTTTPWALGARARAGWLSPEQHDGNPAFGGYLVSGWLFGLRSETHFGYVLGGGGVEAYRGAAQAGLQGLAGVSMHGTLVGVGFESGVGFEPYAVWMLQLGFGRLL